MLEDYHAIRSARDAYAEAAETVGRLIPRRSGLGNAAFFLVQSDVRRAAEFAFVDDLQDGVLVYRDHKRDDLFVIAALNIGGGAHSEPRCIERFNQLFQSPYRNSRVTAELLDP